MPTASKKLKIDKKYLQHIKRNRLGIRSYTKKSSASLTVNQGMSVKERLPKLYNKILRKIVVIDDESYVLQNPKETPGRQYFHTKDPSKVKNKDKIKCLSKFPKKFLV